MRLITGTGKPRKNVSIELDNGHNIHLAAGVEIGIVIAVEDSEPEARPELLVAAAEAAKALERIAYIANGLPKAQAARIYAAMPRGYGDLQNALAKH